MNAIIGMSASTWSALAAWAGVALASFAGAVAYRQLGEARRLRAEQAQPYVVIFTELSAAGSWVIDLVVKNLGSTAATNVRVRIDPPAERAAGGQGISEVQIPDPIPVLVPGQEWRTLWDTGIARADSGLPDRHMATVAYDDAHGRKSFEFAFVLDWATIKARDVVTVYGTHQAAEALREIRSTLARWNETGAGGLRAYTRDGDARDERARAEWEKRRAQEESGDGP
jgi:hypothetical protein